MRGVRTAFFVLALCAVLSAQAYTTGSGEYDDGHDFHAWNMVRSGATSSYSYFGRVDGWWWQNDTPKYVAKRMGPKAQRLTAGAIYYFLRKVGYPDS